MKSLVWRPRTGAPEEYQIFQKFKEIFIFYIQSLKSNFASAAPTQNSKRFFIVENKQFHQLKRKK